MRLRCFNCRVWDDRKAKFVYHMAKKTDWKPSAGYDPRLRQFYCANCGFEFYKTFADAELSQEWKENTPSCTGV